MAFVFRRVQHDRGLGEFFSSVPLTPLWKRGAGEIFGRNVAAIYATDFRYTTLAGIG
jgi:hypothetical protein